MGSAAILSSLESEDYQTSIRNHHTHPGTWEILRTPLSTSILEAPWSTDIHLASSNPGHPVLQAAATWWCGAQPANLLSQAWLHLSISIHPMRKTHKTLGSNSSNSKNAFFVFKRRVQCHCKVVVTIKAHHRGKLGTPKPDQCRSGVRGVFFDKQVRSPVSKSWLLCSCEFSSSSPVSKLVADTIDPWMETQPLEFGNTWQRFALRLSRLEALPSWSNAWNGRVTDIMGPATSYHDYPKSSKAFSSWQSCGWNHLKSRFAWISNGF